MRVENMDNSVLKSICDSLIEQMGEGFIFFANVVGENVQFIARSSCSVNAGFIVKQASIESLGNGGGSAHFAQGGGKTVDKLDVIFTYVRKEIANAQ